MLTTPGMTVSVTSTGSSTAPTRDVTRASSPLAISRRAASAGWELRGWLVQRPGSLLPGGRPVVEQDTALGDVLPLGPGLHAFRTVEEAAAALGAVEADYARASAHAAAVAREYFAAERVLGALRRVAGLCRGLGPSTGRSRSPTRRRSA